MKERDQTTKLMEALRHAMPGAVVIKLNDLHTHGIPDLTVTWLGHTLWIEVKVATPKLTQKRIQHDTMLKLQRNGFALYVIYDKHRRLTFLCYPEDLGEYVIDHLVAVPWYQNHHAEIAEYIEQMFKQSSECSLAKNLGVERT